MEIAEIVEPDAEPELEPEPQPGNVAATAAAKVDLQNVRLCMLLPPEISRLKPLPQCCCYLLIVVTLAEVGAVTGEIFVFLRRIFAV